MAGVLCEYTTKAQSAEADGLAAEAQRDWQREKKTNETILQSLTNSWGKF